MSDIHQADTFSPALPVGMLLGKYTILKVIGSGGFGITYLAQEKDSDNLVVIKENYPADISFRDMRSLTLGPAGEYKKETYDWALSRFLDEARLLASLNHPNIVPIKKAFTALGTAYYVMPHVEGIELQKAAPSPDNITAEWLLPVLEKIISALSYIHAQGLIHRDIKPNNILMRADGEPVLIDFGTARSLESTHSHTHMGTPGFMPIEQFSTRGKRGPWTDFYALGATCYYLITGEIPPPSTDRVMDDEYHPLASRPSLAKRFPEHVLSSIDKALLIDRRKRWQNAQEWLESLKIKSNSNISPRTKQKPATSPLPSQKTAQPETKPLPGSPKKKKKILGVISVLLFLALGSGGYFYYHQPAVQPMSTDKSPAIPVAENTPEQNNVETQPTKSPANSVAENNTEQINSNNQLAGVNPEQYNALLYTAANTGDTEKVRLLLEAGADANWTHENQTTPLYQAASKGHTECVRLLLAAPGIDVNKSNNRSETPLYDAAYRGHTECVRLLLAAPGIDVNKSNNRGETPLYNAAYRGHTECVRLLLAAPGIDVNKANYIDETPLSEAARQGHTECVRLLLAMPGIDVNKTNDRGETSLHGAAWRGHTECVRLLLAVPGIDVNAGRSPLRSAEGFRYTECARLIREAGGR